MCAQTQTRAEHEKQQLLVLLRSGPGAREARTVHWHRKDERRCEALDSYRSYERRCEAIDIYRSYVHMHQAQCERQQHRVCILRREVLLQIPEPIVGLEGVEVSCVHFLLWFLFFILFISYISFPISVSTWGQKA